LTADQILAVRSVENGFQNTALANDGNPMLLALSGTYTALAVSGLLAGMTISSGANSVTVTGPDQAVNLTGWNLNNLQLTNAGTGSTTLLFTAQSTHAATGDIATTYHVVSLANGTSQLVDLTSGADARTGSAAADLIRGADGDDVLNGGGGNDRLEGGANNDTLNGDAGNDLLLGEAGNDILFGGADNDTLLGGNDNDSLRGGSGNDLLVGGSGADTFLWRSGDTGNDVVKDFKSSEGDRIDLRDLLQGENDSNILNYLRVDTATSTLQISTTGQFNAGGSADVTIKLENGSGGNVDLSSLGNTSADIVNSLIAGANPMVKVDHS
jgi:Ca2+-binding RTX toxin-like protein